MALVVAPGLSMLSREFMKSKTLWANAVLAAVCTFVPGAEDYIAKHPVAAINLFSVLQALLSRKRKPKDVGKTS